MSSVLQRPHHHAAGGQLVDQVLGEQQAEGLAQRRAAHLQLRGELRLVQPLPRLELAGRGCVAAARCRRAGRRRRAAVRSVIGLPSCTLVYKYAFMSTSLARPTRRRSSVASDSTPDHAPSRAADTLRRFGAELLAARGVPADDARPARRHAGHRRAVGPRLARHAPPALVRRPPAAAVPWRRSPTSRRVTRHRGRGRARRAATASARSSPTRAVDVGIERARRHGIAGVAVRNSGHFGTAAYFTRHGGRGRAASPSSCTNASPAMAPWGGRHKSIGTNPWSIAAPAGRHGVVVMDLANTAVARGKVYLAAERGTEHPGGLGSRCRRQRDHRPAPRPSTASSCRWPAPRATSSRS